jgi:hypothetical protein
VGAIDLELIAVTNVDALIVEIDRFLQTMWYLSSILFTKT